MKKLSILFILLISGFFSSAQSGYDISITLKPYKNQYVYLGYYYGKLRALADSAKLNASSSGKFIGKTKLPGGIYFIVSPKKEILFEVLIDKQQRFSIVADTTSIPASVAFTGSPDNTMFQDYSKFISAHGKEINDYTVRLTSASSTDSAAITSRLKTLNKEVQDYRNKVEKASPTSLLAALFRALKEPVIPPAAAQHDSTFAYRYFKAHYWDGISFTDERLLRTPIFEAKLEKYYKDLVLPDPDSIKKEIDIMLLKSAPNKEMYKFLLIHFVQKYINPEYMGQDAVFVHLFERYINNNPQVDWFTEKYNKYMSDRAYSLMANLIGQPAYNMTMTDTLERTTTLYSVSAPFTVICFWDPTCGHCKEVVPKLDSIYQKKWKQHGVRLVGVMVDGGKENWLQYIRKNNLTDWVHVYETTEQKEALSAAGKPNFRQLYDVYQTPILYLLDKDKRIIAKKLTYEQLDQVIDLKLKNPN
jgi:thiol-disulfide isomerase/thioredoxin